MNRQREVEERSRRPGGDDARERLSAGTPDTEPIGGHPMSTMTRARSRAAIVAIAPTVLLAGFVYHPYIADLTDNARDGNRMPDHCPLREAQTVSKERSPNFASNLVWHQTRSGGGSGRRTRFSSAVGKG
jgi:hypothetical protein